MSLLSLFKKKEATPDQAHNMKVVREYRNSLERLARTHGAITVVKNVHKVLEAFFQMYKLPVVGDAPEKMQFKGTAQQIQAQHAFYSAFYDNKEDLEVLGTKLIDLLTYLADRRLSEPSDFDKNSLTAILQDAYAAFNKKLKHTVQEQQMTALSYEMVPQKEPFRADCNKFLRTLDESMNKISELVKELALIEQKV